MTDISTEAIELLDHKIRPIHPKTETITLFSVTAIQVSNMLRAQAARIAELESASAWRLIDDELDGVLFRFWIRAASYPDGWPGEFMMAIAHCKTPDQYRKALIDLAHKKGVNLPTPSKEPPNEPTCTKTP